MISFAAEFPVRSGRTAADFIGAIVAWLVGSPHTQFQASDLCDMGKRNEFRGRKGTEELEVLKISVLN